MGTNRPLDGVRVAASESEEAMVLLGHATGKEYGLC
jgi:hypothetical protein